MTRSWFASPTRVRPGDPFPGKYEPSFYDYVGPDPRVMPQMRGPFDTVKQAAEAAKVWREEGKRSDIWLVLVEGKVAQHCNVYVPDYHSHKHAFQHGGKCRTCDEWCPHPLFKPTKSGPTCTTCGCLKPLEGSPDFYEIGLDIGWQPCTLGVK